MKTQTEALKLALEALEMVKANADDWQERTGKEIKGWMQPVNNTITAIKEALAQPERTWKGQIDNDAFFKSVESQPEQEPFLVACGNCHEGFADMGHVCKKCLGAGWVNNPQPKEPEQEPLDTPLPCDVKVGHVTIRKGVALSVLVARMQVLYDMAQPKEPEQEPVAWRVSYPNDPELGFWFAEGIGGEGCLNEPLYTTPPQRTWVDLTEAEIDEICLGDEAKVRTALELIKDKNTKGTEK